MYLKACNSLSELSKASEETLIELGCRFNKTNLKRRVDFEVASPSCFLISIEDMSSEFAHHDWKLAMFTREETGSSFLITTPSEDEAVSLASRFVAMLLPRLKRKPWDGLGFVRSKTSRILWNKWLDRSFGRTA